MDRRYYFGQNKGGKGRDQVSFARMNPAIKPSIRPTRKAALAGLTDGVREVETREEEETRGRLKAWDCRYSPFVLVHHWAPAVWKKHYSITRP